MKWHSKIEIGVILIFLSVVLVACRDNAQLTEPPIDSPNPFLSAQSAIHEVIRVTDVTGFQTDGLYEVECETLYSSNPDRNGLGTVYFNSEYISTVELGQVYFVRLLQRSSKFVYSVIGMVGSTDGVFHLGWTDETGWSENVRGDFWALTAINSYIESNNMNPDEQIISMPEKPLRGDVTIDEVVNFLISTASAYEEMLRR